MRAQPSVWARSWIAAALASLLTSPLAWADAYNGFFFFGAGVFAYEYDPLTGGPDPTPDTLLAVGDGLAVVGFIYSFSDCHLGPIDVTAREYTMVIDRFRVIARHEWMGFTAHDGDGSGRVRVFEDVPGAGSHGEYGTFPPNATAPSSFGDEDGFGALLLEGRLRLPQAVFNSANQSWALTGEVDWQNGLLLALLPEKVRRFTTFSGSGFASEYVPVPPGYLHWASLEFRLAEESCSATDTRASTWGRLKVLYR